MNEKSNELRTLITNILLFYLLIQIPFNYYASGEKFSDGVVKTLALAQLLLPPLAVAFWAYKKNLFTGKFFPSGYIWRPIDWVLLPLFAASFYVLADSLSDLLFLILPKEMQQQLLNDVYAVSFDFVRVKNGFDILVIVIGFGVIVPLLEELIFRGLVFSKIREVLGINKATLYSAAFWGFLQMNPLDFLSLLIMGIILGYLVYKTNSLLLPMGIQILFTLSTLLYLNMAEKNEYLALPPLHEAIIYLILAVFGLYLGVRLTEHYHKGDQ